MNNFGLVRRLTFIWNPLICLIVIGMAIRICGGAVQCYACEPSPNCGPEIKEPPPAFVTKVTCDWCMGWSGQFITNPTGDGKAFTTFRGCGDPNTVDSRVTATLKETISRAKERNTHQESLGNQKGDLAVRVCNLPLCNNWIYIGDPDKATPTEKGGTPQQSIDERAGLKSGASNNTGNNSTSKTDDAAGTSSMTLVGIIAGVLIGLAVIAGLVWYLRKRLAGGDEGGDDDENASEGE